jgi:hypothetical protein
VDWVPVAFSVAVVGLLILSVIRAWRMERANHTPKDPAGADALGDLVIGDAFGGTGPTKVRRSSNPFLPIVALMVLLVFLGVISLMNGSSENSLGHDLQSHGVRTVGTVTVADQSNHDHFEYSYAVKGAQYSGDSGSFTSAESEDASQYQVGQHIAVTYDTEDPQQSCSCDVDLLASSAWSNDLFPLFFAVPVVVVMVVALLIRHRRHQGADV